MPTVRMPEKKDFTAAELKRRELLGRGSGRHEVIAQRLTGGGGSYKLVWDELQWELRRV